jgi:hypothetical protein
MKLLVFTFRNLDSKSLQFAGSVWFRVRLLPLRCRYKALYLYIYIWTWGVSERFYQSYEQRMLITRVSTQHFTSVENRILNFCVGWNVTWLSLVHCLSYCGTVCTLAVNQLSALRDSTIEKDRVPRNLIIWIKKREDDNSYFKVMWNWCSGEPM